MLQLFLGAMKMNKQLYRYYLVMALSFIIDSIISYYYGLRRHPH